MINPIITYEQLKSTLGGNTPSEVIMRLEQSHIKWLPGKRGRPYTTVFALNAAMGLSSQPEQEAEPKIEVL